MLLFLGCMHLLSNSLYGFHRQPTRKKPVPFNYRIQISNYMYIIYIQTQHIIILHYTRDGVVFSIHIFWTFLFLSRIKVIKLPYLGGQTYSASIWHRISAYIYLQYTCSHIYIPIYFIVYNIRVQGNPLGRSQYRIKNWRISINIQSRRRGYNII